MAGRWGRTEGLIVPRWVVALIVGGAMSVAGGVGGVTWWAGHNSGLVVQELKGLVKTVDEWREVGTVAHAQTQRNSREISEIRGRLAMTPAGLAVVPGAPRVPGGRQ